MGHGAKKFGRMSIDKVHGTLSSELIAVYGGSVREVYEIAAWLPAESTMYADADRQFGSLSCSTPTLAAVGVDGDPGGVDPFSRSRSRSRRAALLAPLISAMTRNAISTAQLREGGPQ